MTWTKQTKASDSWTKITKSTMETTDGFLAGMGFLARPFLSTTNYIWTNITKATDSWTKQTKAT